MIFRNKRAAADERGLYVDDILEADFEIMPKEIIAKTPLPKGKVISGTFGKFNINDFENEIRRD